ncbi:DUF5677 domain-containing protein [Phreatobacter sp.]|uniref:DUF5677 domain-containing protein n=1 Tax=Phreatobacter sp. TaxID=1966341 RepID=UPI0025FA397B|nr:DUF5677 domain-containing protein [Phreatobacter sp.]
MAIPNFAVVYAGKIVGDMQAHYRSLPLGASVGRYESEVEALLLLLQGVRHIDAVIELSRSSPDYVPSAMVLARAALESVTLAAWLISPEDPFERECRYIAHLERDISARTRIAQRKGDEFIQQDRENDAIKEFYESLKTALAEQGYVHIPRMPKIVVMISDVFGRDMAQHYIHASQYAHGGHYSTWLYRRNLGSMKEIELSIEPRQWRHAFCLCLDVMGIPAGKIVQRLTGIEPLFTQIWVAEKKAELVRQFLG